MKKLLIIPLTLMLTAAMAIPAYAVTPSYGVDIPDFSDIEFHFKFELPDAFWNDWFQEHPLKFDFSGIRFDF